MQRMQQRCQAAASWIRCKTHICAMCKDEVADIDDFMNVDVEMMSK